MESRALALTLAVLAECGLDGWEVRVNTRLTRTLGRCPWGTCRSKSMRIIIHRISHHEVSFKTRWSTDSTARFMRNRLTRH